MAAPGVITFGLGVKNVHDTVLASGKNGGV
jgi:hypothetical protein